MYRHTPGEKGYFHLRNGMNGNVVMVSRLGRTIDIPNGPGRDRRDARRRNDGHRDRQ